MGILKDAVEKDSHRWNLEGGCPAGALFQCSDCGKTVVSSVEDPGDGSEAVQLPDLDGYEGMCMSGDKPADKME